MISTEYCYGVRKEISIAVKLSEIFKNRLSKGHLVVILADADARNNVKGFILWSLPLLALGDRHIAMYVLVCILLSTDFYAGGF